MTLKSGQVWTGVIVCKDATGAIVAPGVGPAGALYVNGILNGAGVVVAGANPYRWTVTLPALAAGDCVSMYITATIAGVATAGVVWEDVTDTIRLSEVAASVWTYATRTLTSISLLTTSIAQAVWTYVSRTLTQPWGKWWIPPEGDDVMILRGDTWRWTWGGLGDLTGYSKLWLTVKAELDDTDAQAQILVLLTNPADPADGLKAIAGATVALPGNLNASLTVTDLVAGNVDVLVEAVETARLSASKKWWYDIQALTAAGNTETLQRGRALVESDVTRATS